MTYMKASVLLVTIFFGAFGIASAAPLLCVSGGTMDSYVALGSEGCTFGNFLFSNFAYSDSGSAPGSQVSLTLIGSSLNPGLRFSSSGWSAIGGASSVSLDSSILFDVSTVDGRPLIQAATLVLVSSGTTGNSGGTIGESVLAPGHFHLEVDAGGPYSSGVVFAPTNLIHIEKDLSVLAMGTGDSAFIGAFDEGFSSSGPEPVAAVLIGSGLLALGIFRRRVKRG
jgi:hypothetical protein